MLCLYKSYSTVKQEKKNEERKKEKETTKALLLKSNRATELQSS